MSLVFRDLRSLMMMVLFYCRWCVYHLLLWLLLLVLVGHKYLFLVVASFAQLNGLLAVVDLWKHDFALLMM